MNESLAGWLILGVRGTVSEGDQGSGNLVYSERAGDDASLLN